MLMLTLGCGDGDGASPPAPKEVDEGFSTEMPADQEPQPPPPKARPSLPYWDEGIHLESPGKRLTVRFGGRLNVDGGRIVANDALNQAFPDNEDGGIEIHIP